MSAIESVLLALFYIFLAAFGVVLLISLLTVLVIGLLLPRKARRESMKMLSYFYHCCWCRFSFRRKQIDLEDAIDRFIEDIPDRKTFLKTLENEKHLKQVLDVLNRCLPQFQFSIIPTGSLRERFGKVKPSTSVLSSDYDMMLIPENCFAKLSAPLRLDTTEQIEEKDNVFEAIRTADTTEGFAWLKLNQNLTPRHEHWTGYTTYKKVDGEDTAVLSNDKVRQTIKDSLVKTVDKLLFFETVNEAFKTGTMDHQYNVDITIHGPAVTIKVVKYKRQWQWVKMMQVFLCLCCCPLYFSYFCFLWCFVRACESGVSKNSIIDTVYFYCDFTLALCCKEWPNDAQEWFNRPRNWPEGDVVNRIRYSAVHLVPKPEKSLSAISFVETQPDVEDHLNQIAGFTNNSGVQFRFSFSQAETMLADAVPEKARHSYIALKSSIKRMQEKLFGDEWKFEISSYALKSILFRTLEETTPIYWTQTEEEGNRFKRKNFLIAMLQKLHAELSVRYCPHYWMKTKNLFQNFIPEEDDLQKEQEDKLMSFDKLLTEIQLFIAQPTHYLLDDWVECSRCIRQCCCLPTPPYCNNKDPIECDCSFNDNNTCCGPCPFDDDENNEVFAVY